MPPHKVVTIVKVEVLRPSIECLLPSHFLIGPPPRMAWWAVNMRVNQMLCTRKRRRLQKTHTANMKQNREEKWDVPIFAVL